MPYIGETKKGLEIGRRGRNKYIWAACLGCGKERWVFVKSNKADSDYCAQCGQKKAAPLRAQKYRGAKNGWWRGGITIDKNGYRMVKCYPEDFYHPMVNNANYVREHRLVMAQHLGRCLQPWEVVHHRNGDKTDNRIENLELNTANTHSSDHGKGYRDGFQKGLQDGRLK